MGDKGLYSQSDCKALAGAPVQCAGIDKSAKIHGFNWKHQENIKQHAREVVTRSWKAGLCNMYQLGI
jgi:hypothetical protein